MLPFALHYIIIGSIVGIVPYRQLEGRLLHCISVFRSVVSELQVDRFVTPVWFTILSGSRRSNVSNFITKHQQLLVCSLFCPVDPCELIIIVGSCHPLLVAWLYASHLYTWSARYWQERWETAKKPIKKLNQLKNKLYRCSLWRSSGNHELAMYSNNIPDPANLSAASLLAAQIWNKVFRIGLYVSQGVSCVVFQIFWRWEQVICNSSFRSCISIATQYNSS